MDIKSVGEPWSIVYVARPVADIDPDKFMSATNAQRNSMLRAIAKTTGAKP